MSQLNLTNVYGEDVSIILLEINSVQLVSTPQSLAAGSTYFGSYENSTASQFSDFQLQISTTSGDYQISLNRAHWFGTSDGAYPGSDYDMNLVLMGMNSTEIQLCLAYSNAGSPPFTFSTDLSKEMDLVTPS